MVKPENSSFLTQMSDIGVFCTYCRYEKVRLSRSEIAKLRLPLLAVLLQYYYHKVSIIHSAILSHTELQLALVHAEVSLQKSMLHFRFQTLIKENLATGICHHMVPTRILLKNYAENLINSHILIRFNHNICL